MIFERKEDLEVSKIVGNLIMSVNILNRLDTSLFSPTDKQTSYKHYFSGCEIQNIVYICEFIETNYFKSAP